VHLVIGVVTLLVLTIGGYISFNALNGLPLQNYYDVNVELPSADRLIATDDVRIAGVRIGQVSKVQAEPGRDGGAPYALVALQLQHSAARLPLDTTVEVRSASVLGTTYVALTIGRSRRTLASGATLPLTHASASVDITDLFQIFKGSAARNYQASTADFAAGLAGEGQAFGATVSSLAALMGPLSTVAHTLAAPPTQLARFIDAGDHTFSALAPISGQVSGLVSGAAETFGAFATQRVALGHTIAAAPGSQSAGTTALHAALPGLHSLTEVLGALAPAAPLLHGALATLNATFVAGTRPLRAFPPFAHALHSTFTVLGRTGPVPSNTGAVRKLAQLTVAGRDAVAPLETAQVHCNVFSLLAIGVSSFLGSLGTGDGPSLSNTPIDNQGNSTDMTQSAKPAPNAGINYAPEENGTECAAGNEELKPGTQDLTNPSGLPDTTRTTTPPPGVLQRAASVGLLAKASP
jgi:phospholipid/cholesterol/gamma-HCH transport system substrate-binding protein